MNSTGEMSKPFTIQPCYGWTELSPSDLKKTLEESTAKVGDLCRVFEVDTLAFSGSSGAAFAFYISAQLNIPLLYVRKENEVSHGKPLECNSTKQICRYLIIDDFICSGSTIKHIYETISDSATQRKCVPPQCAGVFLYTTGFRMTDTIKMHDDTQLRIFNRSEFNIPVFQEEKNIKVALSYKNSDFDNISGLPVAEYSTIYD